MDGNDFLISDFISVINQKRRRMHKGESEVHAFHFSSHFHPTPSFPTSRPAAPAQSKPPQLRLRLRLRSAMPAPVHRSRSHFLRVFAIKEVTGNGGGVSESTTGTPATVTALNDNSRVFSVANSRRHIGRRWQ